MVPAVNCWAFDEEDRIRSWCSLCEIGIHTVRIIHLLTTLIRRTSGRSLGIVKKSISTGQAITLTLAVSRGLCFSSQKLEHYFIYYDNVCRCWQFYSYTLFTWLQNIHYRHFRSRARFLVLNLYGLLHIERTDHDSPFWSSTKPQYTSDYAGSYSNKRPSILDLIFHSLSND